MKYTKSLARMTDAEMLYRFYLLYQHLGHWPTITELRENHEFLGTSPRNYQMRFGNLKSLIAATKLTYSLLNESELATILPLQEKILKELARHYGQTLYWQGRTTYLEDERLATVSDFAYYCGGLDAALREIGLPVCTPGREDLIAALSVAYADLGRTPRLMDCSDKLCTYPTSAYLSEFKTWNNGLTAAGIPLKLNQPNRKRTYRRQLYSAYHPNQSGASHPNILPDSAEIAS